MGFVTFNFPDLQSLLSFRAMEDQLETDFCRKVSMAECEGDDYELQEKKWEMEEESSEGDEPTEDDAHQMFEIIPKRVHRFYFVKWWPYENPNADAMIKRDEEIIENMNRSLLHITEQINQENADHNKLSLQRERLRRNKEGLRTEVMWWDYRLDSKLKALDRLSFANNAHSTKGFKSCLSNGEVDKQKLHFQMLHGCRSMSDEKKILREISAGQKKDVGITIEDLNATILQARRQLNFYDWYQKNQTGNNLNFYDCYQRNQAGNNTVDREAILREINRAVHAKEKATANAVVNGKLWNSLGSKRDHQNELKGMDSERMEMFKKRRVVEGKIKSLEKSMPKIEKRMVSLQKKHIETRYRKDEAYESILSLKKLYGEENARFYQYRLLRQKATTLAEKKDIAALQELSCKEVEDFMSMWNSDKAFREDYKKRSVRSLNARRLGKDGRRRKDDDDDEMQFDEEAPKIIKPEALSKTRLQWLMKDGGACHPSSSTILAPARTK